MFVWKLSKFAHLQNLLECEHKYFRTFYLDQILMTMTSTVPLRELLNYRANIDKLHNIR